jgi:antitoxin PrlF
MNASSRLTQKFQATIPAAVRELLSLDKGDVIAFEVEGDKVYLRKATPLDEIYLKSLEGTLTEWSSPIDDEAFHGL